MKDDRAAALAANVAAYGAYDDRTYINGAPHIKHASIGAIYRSMVDEAIRDVGAAPQEVSVLELGAGNGLASGAWLERRVRITAVDSSEPMLREFQERGSQAGFRVETIVADALDFLQSTDRRFDIVTHVSMLHHVPDYLGLLKRSAGVVRAGGCLITFQDPLLYARQPRYHRVLDRASYFIWRAGQGNVRRGLKTRWRRLRGVYSPSEVVDFEDYHVVRAGVDSEAIMALLNTSFERVKIVPYWSTYAAPLQRLGERMRLTSSFGILASGRRQS